LVNVAYAARRNFFPDSIIHGEATAPHGFHQEQIFTPRVINQLGGLFQIHR